MRSNKNAFTPTFGTLPGQPRMLPIAIGGTSYKPPIPDVLKIRNDIKSLMEKNSTVQERAADLCLYCMKTQVFQDGNKRASVIFANHYLISNSGGLLVIDEDKVSNFKNLLIEYYEGKNQKAKEFLMDGCIIKIK